MSEPTSAELAELDQLRAGAEANLDRKIAIVRELFVAQGESTGTDAVVDLVARGSDAAVRGALTLCLIRLARQAASS